MTTTLTLTGQSGQTYNFACYQPGPAWNEVAGCYAFAIQRGTILTGINTSLFYIGQTDSFKRRMNEHQDDKWTKAAQQGANIILACVVTNEAARLAMEKDLIQAYQPPLNVQHIQQALPIGSLGSLLGPRNRLFPG